MVNCTGWVALRPFCPRHFADLTEEVKIHIMSTQSFDAWLKQKHKTTFWDLNSLATPNQRARIRPIYVSRQHLKQIPLGGWSLSSRMQDATKVAKERALAMKPTDLESELAQQDAKYQAVARHAIERVKFILDDKSHFTRQHRETAKEKREAARQRKRDAYVSLLGPACLGCERCWFAVQRMQQPGKHACPV